MSSHKTFSSFYAEPSGGEGYRHIPLERKLELLDGFTGEKTVCEDVPAHYEYFREHVNANRDDCCSLRRHNATDAAA